MSIDSRWSIGSWRMDSPSIEDGEQGSPSALIFNIQRFSLHDGPGIRTTVFTKGCNLHCRWCHNPESIRRDQEVQFFPDACVGCGNCFDVCPVHAHSAEGGGHVLARDLCTRCGRCVDECYADALVFAAELKTVDQVVAIIEQDRAYYEESDGGVTISGGEPLLSGRFLDELLRELRERSIHTAVDTAGNVPWTRLRDALLLTDLVLYDFKHVDSEAHRSAVGVGNERILENLRRVADTHNHVWIRVPVIPGVNGDLATLTRMADFLADIASVERVELLPFHRLAEAKYRSLGSEYPVQQREPPTDEQMHEFREVFRAHALPVHV